MSLYGIFDIAGSGMSAQSVRLNTTASNLANAQSVSSSVDSTYRARHPIFAAAMQDAMGGDFASAGSEAGRGVQVMGIIEDQSPYQMRYEPSHPMADEKGYVAYPNVNVVEEMVNMITASRSYDAGVTVMKTISGMAKNALNIGG